MLSSTKKKYMFIIYELGNKGNTLQAKQRSVSCADFCTYLKNSEALATKRQNN